MEIRTDPVPIVAVPKVEFKKTSVTWLREICSRFRASEIYTYVETPFLDGTTRIPYFLCTLHLRWKETEHDVTGGGRTKKEAKRVAAAAILVQMDAFAKAELDTIGYHPDKLDLDNITENSEDMGNPVSDLQELCMKLKRSQPIYEFQLNIGNPHDRLYRVACRIGDEFVQYADAVSKKTGKRESARSMLTYINSLEIDVPNEPSYSDDDDKIIEQLQAIRLKKLNNTKSSIPEKKTSASSKKKKPSSIIYENPYTSIPGPEINKLKDDPNFIPVSPIVFLENLGKEQGFKVQYMETPELSTESTYHCIVQLTLEPVATCFGVGLTQREAKVNCALDAIYFIRKMMAK